ncbi:hypothetical protein TrVFT333_010876 [Trichoderma virens FT-333]|nr:hypothetical protein TrVFT333_010876 [Trichoderma virens FT-333]
MAPGALDLDAHEQPSDQMKAEWKHFSRLDQTVLLQETPLDDPRLPLDQSGVPPSFLPKDPAVHNPLSIKQVLQRRLHWVTLGGQYDWTNRVYPEAAPPSFPEDLASFLKALFPETLAQAAIVNFYTPGDTMMMHRDVSEEIDKGLKKYLLLRLRSGDAIYMTKESRYAWHGVPKVMKGTCPDYLADWPAGGENGEFEQWKGWMQNKRINLNVRQMR